MTDNTLRIKRLLVGNIKRCRTKLGLTQEEMAEKADITVKYWQRLEMLSQRDLPSLQMLAKIAKALDVSMSELLKENAA